MWGTMHDVADTAAMKVLQGVQRWNSLHGMYCGIHICYLTMRRVPCRGEVVVLLCGIGLQCFWLGSHATELSSSI